MTVLYLMLPPLFPSIPRSSYYEADYRQGKALLRARRPYIVKNLATGVCLVTFTVSACTYPNNHKDKELH